MQIVNPISFTPPPIGGKTFATRTLTGLDITIRDNPQAKIVQVFIRGVPKPLMLWRDDAYTIAGDYTEKQVEARIATVLGNNPSQVITGLF